MSAILFVRTRVYYRTESNQTKDSQNKLCLREEDVAALFAAADARAKEKMRDGYYTDGSIGKHKDYWALTVEQVAGAHTELQRLGHADPDTVGKLECDEYGRGPLGDWNQCFGKLEITFRV